MATSGTVYSGTKKNSKFYVYWEQTGQSVSGNYTDIKWEAGLRIEGYDKWYSNAVRIDYVKIDGAEVKSSTTYSNVLGDGSNKNFALASGTKRIYHNDNGSKSFSVAINGWLYSYGTVGEGSDSFTLTTIPRNSYTNSVPTWTAPGSVSCTISRYATFTHTVQLQLKNSSGTWESAGSLADQGTSATFSSETVMKKVFQILNGRASCASRFAIYTNGPNGWTYGSEGTCTAAAANTVTAPTFTGTSSATTTITKGNSAFTTTISVTINGQTIGSASQTSATSVTFNNTTALRKACITGLAQTASKSYTVTATTYYAGVKVRSATSKSGTCNAPAADTVTTPNFTAGNSFTCAVSSVSSELSRALTFQIYNGSSWVNIATQSVTTTKSFTWTNNDVVFTALGNGTASRSTRILTTTYYSGVQVRSQTTTSGTCTAPAASTCTKPSWTAGSTFTCAVSRASSLLTHTITLQVKNSAGTLQTFQTVTKSSSTSIAFANTTALNTTLFNYLAQAASRETSLTITTYYKNVRIRSAVTYTGTLTAPAASTCTTTPTWTGGDSLTLSISRANSAFTHTIVVKVNSQTITTLTGVGTSVSFGTSDSDRTKIYTALAQTASKASSVTVTTYYNGVQVRSATTKSGTCNAPTQASPTAPTWTAGNSFNATITLSKSYLVYSIELKVGTVSVQSYNYQTATSLGFAGTAAINLKAYQGLNKNAQATAQFIVKMYYKKSDGTYIQAGPSKTTNGTCTALAANTITAPNWTAGSSFSATVTRKSLNLYSTIKLKVNGQVVQEYGAQESSNLSYSLTFANTKDINTKIYTALAQTANKPAVLEVTTYYGTDVNNLVQVRTPVQSSGTCNSSEPAVGKLTLSQSPAIIDNTEITCNLTKPLSDYTMKVEVRYNNTLITTLTPSASATSVVFNSANFIEALYKAIPTQKSASLQFKVITYYGGTQVQQPKTVAVDMNAKESTVKIKIDTANSFSTTARIKDKSSNTFIDNTSMIGSKLSDLLIAIAKGYFYLESKYGGYISQIKAQIANSSSMIQIFSYTSTNVVYNTEQTRIVNPAFSGNSAIIMGPYDFPSVTEPGTVNNLVITATDSRGYSVTKTVPLKIFPYSAPTIKIDTKTTQRIASSVQHCVINLSGTVSSLYTESGTTKTQTNKLKRITLQYRVYGSTGAYSSYNITAITYNTACTTYKVTNFSTATPGITFNVNDTFEFVITVEDQFGKTNSDSVIILPDRPLMSFREQQIGINIIPRKLANISERSSESGENPALDVNGYIYSNGREVPTFTIVETWTV